MNALRHTILGFFFFATLALLGFVTIYLGGWHPLQNPVTLTCYAENADGLGAGDPVLVLGIQAGRVDEVTANGPQAPRAKRVRIQFTLKEATTLRADYQLMIGSSSLLGGKQLDILVGEGEPLAADAYGDLHAIGEGNLMRSLSRLVGQNEADVRRIIGSFADIADDLKSGRRNLLGLLLEKKGYDDVHAGIASARSILDKVDHGDGSIAKAINQPGLHDELLGFVSEARGVFRDVREKNGALHQIIYDEETGAKFKRGIDGLAAAAERIGKGEGLLGKLTTPESEVTWNDLKSFAADARALAADTRSGKGALGKLFNDPEVESAVATIAKQISAASIDLAALADGARRGRGVLGLLIADDEARRTVSRIIDQLARALEDAREAAPVSSVASFLFGQL